MKIRLFFVSNCSSSAFIVTNKDYRTIFDIAGAMLDIQDKENYNYTVQEKTNKNVIISKFKESKEKQLLSKHNTLIKKQLYGITFPSCNYDTFIVKYGNIYLIETCNNTDWSSIHQQWSENTEDGYFTIESIEGELLRTTEYWWLQHNILGKPAIENGDHKFCNGINKNHYELMININGINRCPKCKDLSKYKLRIQDKSNIKQFKFINI